MLLDLTHLITPEMPMYPGSPAPALAPMGPFAQLGFRETERDARKGYLRCDWRA